MMVRSCKLLVLLARSSFFNIMNRFSFFPLGCKLISHCWFETCGVSWWLTVGTCDSLLTFCFVNICCWFVTSYCYSALMFGTPTSCVFSSWFIYSSQIATFFTTSCCVVSYNCLLKPFINTRDIFFFEPICYKSSGTLLCYSIGSS